jgi:ATP-dependent RNA helicase DDX3X
MHNNGHYDMIASAQTGSGKTFAFVIPTVARLVLEGVMPRPFFPGASAQASPLIVVLSPTRELAMQTMKEVETITIGTRITGICLYGGESLKFQQQKLVQEQKDIICATPGRLVDLVDAGKVSLSFVQSVVFDEADQMMAQSLEITCAELLTGRDMREPNERQTLLFSATMPQKIRDMLPTILKTDMTRVANLTVGHYNEDKGGACASIKQVLKWVPEENQRSMAMVHDLRQLWIGTGKKGRVVIFTNQRLQAGNLANSLNHNGISCVHLHGRLEQHVREEVFDKFRKGQADVLVATNVASRGLDFPDISFVVQYNLHATIDVYTHRIGRTGRIGQVGCALSYVGPKDKHLFPEIVKFLELNKQEVPSFLQPQEERGGRWQRSRSRGRGPPGRGPPRGGPSRGHQGRDDRGGQRWNDRGGGRW